MFEIPRLEAVDIDEEEDFVLAEALMRWKFDKGS
jgi:CMP-N-acetylneuraminic acid synthetase